MEDAGWTLPLFLCFGWFDAPGQGHRPAFAAAAAFGPDTPDQAGTVRANSPSPAPKGWLHPAGGRRLGVRRGAPGLLQA